MCYGHKVFLLFRINKRPLHLIYRIVQFFVLFVLHLLTYYSIWDKGSTYLVLAFSMWHNFINIFFFRPTIFFMKRWSVDNLCYSCGWHKFVIVSWYVCFGCVISLSWCSFSNIYCYHNWVQICANLTITDLFHLIVCPVILIKLIEPLCCQSNLYCVNWFN